MRLGFVVILCLTISVASSMRHITKVKNNQFLLSRNALGHAVKLIGFDTNESAQEALKEDVCEVDPSKPLPKLLFVTRNPKRLGVPTSNGKITDQLMDYVSSNSVDFAVPILLRNKNYIACAWKVDKSMLKKIMKQKDSQVD